MRRVCTAFQWKIGISESWLWEAQICTSTFCNFPCFSFTFMFHVFWLLSCVSSKGSVCTAFQWKATCVSLKAEPCFSVWTLTTLGLWWDNLGYYELVVGAVLSFLCETWPPLGLWWELWAGGRCAAWWRGSRPQSNTGGASLRSEAVGGMGRVGISLRIPGNSQVPRKSRPRIYNFTRNHMEQVVKKSWKIIFLPFY